MNTKYKILHLEDVKTDAELAARELKKSNIQFEQYVVDTEEEFKRALDEFSPDIVLCDHSLASFNSSEALKIFLAKKLNIPFILITATLSDEVAISILKEGADDYILKDRLKRLPNAVINAIEKYRLEREAKQLMAATREQEALSGELLTQFSNKLILATNVACIGIWEYLFQENKLIADDISLSHFALALTDFKGNYSELEHYFHPEDKARVTREFKTALLTKSRLNTEFRIIRQDGSVHFIKVVALIQYNYLEAPLRLIGTNQDVTDLKKAAQAISESEAKFRAFFENSMDGILLAEPNGKILAANPAAWAIFGMTEEELLRSSKSDILDMSDRRALNLIKERQLTGKATGELTCRRKDGSLFPGEISSVIFKDAYGEERTSIIIRDLTTGKLAEQNNKFKAELLNTIGQAVMATDLNGLVNFWNKAAEKIYGWTQEEAIGKNIIDLTPVQQSKEQAIDIMQQLSNGDSWSGEFMVMRKDGGTFPVFVTDAPIYDQYQKLIGIIGVSSDITERKLSEIKLNELNENLQHQANMLARSNAELEQFAYVASHDLQEPLRMVTSFLKLLEKKYENVIDDKGKQYINFAVDGALRMHRIILDLLEFSRIGRLEHNKELLDLNKLVNEIQKLFREHMDEKNAIIHTSELPVIYGNNTQIRQVFQNLVGNALKYSREDVSCQIHIDAKESADYWQFTVADNGIGIGKEFFEKIFIVFQRLHNKDKFSGTGIGLAISKKIIANLGGKIWVESVEGKGSTFYFTIPKIKG